MMVHDDLLEFITYEEAFLRADETAALLAEIDATVDWHTDVKDLVTGVMKSLNRRMAYVSDAPGEYAYAGVGLPGQEWRGTRLRSLCDFVSTRCGVQFNSVLLNSYDDGRDVINWHSDREDCLGDGCVIACVNLGATRKLWFRERVQDSLKFFYELSDGDLLVMESGCQERFLHAVLKESDVKGRRVSLTFRKCDI